MRLPAPVLLFATIILARPVGAAEELVPFAIPTKPNAESLVSVGAGPAIAPDGERIVARAGRFVRAGKRLRVWGVNTCFGANFPTHDDAERAAERLAQGGINSVRLHHMDMHGFPRGIWDSKNPKKLSAEALDRLDYFLDQLARRGIHVNVNLHVSRTHSTVLGLPRSDNMPSFDKVIGLFTPKLIEAQKAYARDLLTHVNAYRKVRYADDPAVAFVEITNEDSFFMWDGERRLRSLAPYYEKILRGLWGRWLTRRYGSTDRLRAAWGKGAEPLGKNLIGDAACTLKPPADAKAPQWSLELHAGTKATARAIKDVANAVRVEIAAVDQTDWHIQFKNVHVPLRGGQYYTISFRARADKPRRISLSAGMAHAPWRGLGLSRTLQITDRWKTCRTGFIATADEPDARISFILGGDRSAVELADVVLATGGQVGLAADEGLDDASVSLFADSEVVARARDRVRFLAETEKAYFDDLRSFVRDELGCKALVTGTIVFGPAGLYAQSGMDFIDAHAYWHHPRFPGRPWDAGNWLIEQTAMTDHPNQATLAPLACRRLAGKPFTVSEYNHPAPLDAQAECVPMVAAYAATQDWDGIWLFAYCHRTNDWHPRRFTSFFDMDTNPAKFGFFAPAAIAFRDGGIAPVGTAALCRVDADDPLSAFAGLMLTYGRSMRNVVAGEAKLDWKDLLSKRVYVSTGAKPPSIARPGQPIVWTVREGKGHFLARGERAIVETGWADGTFRAVMAATLDGQPLGRSRKVLLAACGRCENTEMKFSADRRTVGRNWGRAPVRIEPVDHDLHLPGWASAKATLQPLGPDGQAKGPSVKIALSDTAVLRLSAKHKTMWYLLTRE